MSARWFQLAQLAEQLAHEPGKLKKRAAIAQAIAEIHAAAPASNDAGLFALYLSGSPFAEADARKLSTGGALLSRAVLTVSGATDAALTAAYRRHGDLGAAAFDLLTHSGAPSQTVPSSEVGIRPGPLTLSVVSETFSAIATARTTASRAALVESLLRRAMPLEAKYLIKLMLGDMRIGVKQSLVEEAIAAAANLTHTVPHSSTAASSMSGSANNAGVTPAEVRHAVMLEADLASAVHRAFAGTLAEARMKLFHPLGFMLASPVDSPEAAIARFAKNPGGISAESLHLDQNGSSEARDKIRADPCSSVVGLASPQHIAAFLEDKYDGIRAQLHCADPAQPGRVAIYSRNREDITESFPELCEAFAHATTSGPLILDGEILAWNFIPETKIRVPHPSQLHRDGCDSTEFNVPSAHALPFATLGERIGRKRVSSDLRARVPVVFMAFDLLCAKGELTLNLPLRTRRHMLEAIAQRLTPLTVSPLTPAPIVPAQSTLFQASTETLQPATALPRLILSPSRLVESAQDIDRAYAAARARSNEGVMIKAADSIYQPGRRGLAWVKLKRELATLDVIITGAEYGHGKRAGLLSDYTFAVRRSEDSAELLNVGKAYSGVTDAEIAQLTEFLKAHTLEDHGHFRTVEPLIILEVAFNNIMRSTRHASGFALRFPRILRLRPDKPLAEIDTLARVEAIYESQVDKPREE